MTLTAAERRELELLRQIAARDASPTPQEPFPEVSISDAIGRAGLETFLGSITGAGDLVINAAREIATGPARTLRNFGDPQRQDLGFRGTLDRLTQPVLPSGQEVLAGIEAPIDALFSDRGLGEAFDRRLAVSDNARQERPFSSAVGDAFGTGAALFAGRVPASNAVAEASRVNRLTRAIGGNPSARLLPGAKRALTRVAESPAINTLARAAGRSLETGVEGAALALVQKNDPVEMFGFSAGGQLAGSASLSLLTKPKLLGLAGAAAGMAALIQTTKTATPGGRDRILESIETAFDKVTFGLVLGAAAGIAGAGRFARGTRLAEDLPKFVEAVGSIPRGTAIGVLSQVIDRAEAGDDTIERVLTKLAQEPESFSPSQRNRLERGIKTGSLIKEIDGLMKNSSFRASLKRDTVGSDDVRALSRQSSSLNRVR